MEEKKNNIVGTRIGIFDILYECKHRAKDGHKLFHVKCCLCGWETDFALGQIKRTKKCCHLSASGNYRQPYHWNNGRIGKIFHGMKQRCYNTNDKNYHWYGEKGIQICQEWLSEPKTFEKWAISNGYKDTLTIDRINSDKNYCPENCCWVPLEINSKKAGKVNWIEINGEILSGRDWAKRLGLGVMTINGYLQLYPEEKVKELIKAIIKNPSYVNNNKRKSKHSWFETYGIKL
jgi:hypothetical protein|nr:MAG TPA: hypothetical protein [Caudoviricetes sp.]